MMVAGSTFPSFTIISGICLFPPNMTNGSALSANVTTADTAIPINMYLVFIAYSYFLLVFHTTSTADAMISDGKRKYCGPTTSRHTAAITIPAIAGIWLSAFSH